MTDEHEKMGSALAALRAGSSTTFNAVVRDLQAAIKAPPHMVPNAPELPDHVLERLTPQERLSYLRLMRQKENGR
ncbi:hypothetical protein WDZ92_20290 [Nostoc sp. NIES-2111]